MFDTAKWLTLLSLSIGLTVCVVPVSSGADLGTIEGHVSIGPTVSVCSVDETCNGDYAKANVAIRAAGGEVVAHVTTGERGDFSLDVPAGAYDVVVLPEGLFPRCPEVRVIVTAGASVRADVDCDTGLR